MVNLDKECRPNMLGGWRAIVPILVFYAVFGVAFTMWLSYGDAQDSCQYKVEAVIQSNQPSSDYWDRCVMTVKYQSPLPEDVRTFLHTMELPGKACVTVQDDPQQQGGPGVGKKLQGCVREREPQTFLSEEEGNAPDTDISSLEDIHGMFLKALAFTVAGAFIFAGSVAWAWIAIRRVNAAEVAKERSSGKYMCLVCGSRSVAPNDEVHNAEGEPLLGGAPKSAQQC